METGRVIKFYNSFFFVKIDDELLPCKLRGKMKRDKRAGSAVYPGDFAEVSRQADGSGVIEKVLPRKNLLTRPAVANVDRVILTFAAASPDPHPLPVDKFTVLAENSGIAEILICLNKKDLNSGGSFFDKLEKIYPVIKTSTLTGEGIDELKKILSEGITVFAGPSGVGKSSLLNSLNPDFKLKVGNLSEKILRGKHTTRICELMEFAGGFVVDTPGFAAIELAEAGIYKKNLRHYFKEFEKFAPACKFSTCSHIREPDCAVKSAVESGEIFKGRYDSYISIMSELSEEKQKKGFN